MIIIIKKLKSGEGWATPLTWLPIKLDKNKLSARIICGNSHPGILEIHEILSDGTVTPSLVCSECDWHETVKLEDWSE